MPLQQGDEQDLPGSTTGGIFGCWTVGLRDHPLFKRLRTAAASVGCDSAPFRGFRLDFPAAKRL